jgi:transcriptional regulator with XRE-family HTH domain
MAHDPDKLIGNVSRRIAELRKLRGFTQDALADEAGVTGGYIRLLEGGKQNITLSTISRLAHLLHCEPKDFFDEPKSTKPLPGRPRSRKEK